MNKMGKVCKKCKSFKDFREFHRCSGSLDGYKPLCKICKKEQRHLEYINNKEHQDTLNKKWRQNNKERLKIINKKYQLTEKRKLYIKHYRLTHRKEMAERMRRYLKTNLNYNISSKLRHRLNEALKSQRVRKTNKALELLGCSIDQFRLYLQFRFKDGMNWENRGKWHIDHIKPCAKFDLTKIEEQK